MSKVGSPDAAISVDWEATALAKVSTYLTDWSLLDDDEDKLPLDPDTLSSLHPDVFELIEKAIDKHQKAVEEQVKNSRKRKSSESEATSA